MHSVREVLDNPKHTGYMVWNRRKNARPDRGVTGRVNPPSRWVWSSQPTHEPLITRDLFQAASAIGRFRQGSRPGPGANRHPATKRTYLLRSYLSCGVCGRRLLEARRDPAARLGACKRIGEQLGINPETLRRWVTQAEVDAGGRPGTTTSDAQRIVELEREVRELRRANVLLKSASSLSSRRARPPTTLIVDYIDPAQG